MKLSLDVSKNITGAELKQQFFKAYKKEDASISLDHIRVIYKGKLVENDTIFTAEDLENADNFYCVVTIKANKNKLFKPKHPKRLKIEEDLSQLNEDNFTPSIFFTASKS